MVVALAYTGSKGIESLVPREDVLFMRKEANDPLDNPSHLVVFSMAIRGLILGTFCRKKSVNSPPK